MILLVSRIIWAAPRKKGPSGNFEQNVYYPISWMVIILRWICENLSCIAVKISIQWGCEQYMYMQKPHLQQVSRRGIYVTICKILLLLFCIWTSYISLSNYLVLILKFFTVPVHLHNITNFLNHETLQSKHVSKFFTAKIAMLRALFAWRGSFNIVTVVNKRCQSSNAPAWNGAKWYGDW